ncbi:MAG: hypothetical protein K5696_10400 [Lachnospiraceae bacterium]|nr:hypothetical protein [Lachnospiraceae bacterium]
MILLPAAALTLSGCAVDRLRDLDVVYDLSQQDQRDAGLFEYGAGNSSFVVLGPKVQQQEQSRQSETSEAEEQQPAAGQSVGVLEEDFEALPEQMELSDSKRSREDIEREDEELRTRIGLTEEKIAGLIQDNQGNYYFDHMDDAGKRLYAELLHIIRARGEKIRVSSLSEEEVDRAFQYLLADHPELFCTDGYTYTRYTVDGELFKLGFTARYLYDATEESIRSAEIEARTAEILAGAPQTTDQYELARYVYEYIIDHTEYVIGAPDNQNICSVFLSGQSVCQGYAKATQLLLNRLGVPTTLATGTVTAGDRPGTRHAWNMTRVNGRDYYLDTTWGDSSFQQTASEEEPIRRINYDYLLDTTEDISDTHQLDDLVEMPLCTHLEDNYYVRDGAYFTEADPEQLDDLFRRAYDEGRATVTLKCADMGVFDALTDRLVTDRGVFDYLRSDNNSASFASSEMQRTLTFVLI